MKPEPTTTFLTEAQRAALDAALAAKAQAKDNAGQKAPHHDSGSARKHGALHVKPVHGLAGDRKNKQNKGTGAAKKGGGGGKFTWGSMLSEAAAPVPGALDRNDPNYDSEEDAEVKETFRSAVPRPHDADDDDDDAGYEPVYQSQSRIVQAVMKYKADIMEILKEYLESGDMAEAAACIGELQLPQYDYYIVKRAVTIAMDRKDREKEAISTLLSNLYGQYISPPQMQKGFVSILEGLDDLILDVPDAVEVMSLFICRAITDEILPPSFIGRLIPPPASALEELKHKCTSHLDQKHSAERLMRCWGADAKLAFADAREKINAMLKEYVNSSDIGEVERQLRSLSAPFFHHEVVKQAVLLATDDMSHAENPLVTLLAQLSASAEISSFQVYKGFQRVVDQLDDLALDNPSLHENFRRVYADCVARGIIDAADQSVLAEAERRSVDGESAGAAAARTVAAFKRETVATLQEYFNSMDSAEVAQRLQERKEPGMLHIFVKQALQVAMERTFRERELVSQLFVDLVPGTIHREQLAMGLVRLLAALDDLVLDIPDAAHLATLFLARLVVDEVLPPAALAAALDSLRADALGVLVVDNAKTLLTSRHAAERVLGCWHGGLQTIEQLNGQMKMIVAEYVTAADVGEAVRSLHELCVPHYHHEFVRRVLEGAFEAPNARESLVRLLQHVAETGEVNQTQLWKGIKRVQGALDDYSLDYPHARATVEEFVSRGRAGKWLEDEA